ncbi:MAG: restriction endonuclease [Halanaerobiales bacterium]
MLIKLEYFFLEIKAFFKSGDKMNLFENINTDMTPTEFEKYCLDLLDGIKEKLEKCKIDHNEICITDDGQYQLDGVLEFEQFGVKYKTIVECKKYKYKIKRQQIQVLHDTIRSTGAHKGIFISTSSFQSGAMEYAKKHGIALMQVIDGHLITLQNSINKRKFYFSVPKYVFAFYDLEYFAPMEIISKNKNDYLIEYLLDN